MTESTECYSVPNTIETSMCILICDKRFTWLALLIIVSLERESRAPQNVILGHIAICASTVADSISATYNLPYFVMMYSTQWLVSAWKHSSYLLSLQK